MINKIRKNLTRISPKLNTILMFILRKKRLPKLKNPESFDDKITWMKLNYYPKIDLVAKCADKVMVRNYIIETGFPEILNDLYGTYQHSNQIEFSNLPKSFVIKWNNDFGSTIVVKNKFDIDLEKLRKKVQQKKDPTFYLLAAEMHYKNIKPLILIEKYLIEEGTNDLTDYKFYCYHGVPKFVMVCTGRASQQTKFYFYDMEWNLLRINRDGKQCSEDFNLTKPVNFEQMVDIAAKLSKPFPFVRTDLYNLEGEIFFGEMTFTPASGSDPGMSKEQDLFLSKDLILP